MGDWGETMEIEFGRALVTALTWGAILVLVMVGLVVLFWVVLGLATLGIAIKEWLAARRNRRG